jgi:endonuclease/exonuclease/phosphatase family metal-dependent hydrolase
VTRLRVATYNVHSAVGSDGRFDPDRIAQVVSELDADVIALQEVESKNGAEDMLARLAAASGHRAIAGPTMLRPDSSYGNALLTRCDVVDVQRVDLSVAAREPRGALDVRLACRGTGLRVLATHLGLRPAERRQQIRALLARLEGGECVLTLLLGDLNEWFLWGRPLRWLHRYFRQTPAPATFPARFPLFALDRLWVKPRGRLRRVYVHGSPLARLASDHRPLVAEIDA